MTGAVSQSQADRRQDEVDGLVKSLPLASDDMAFDEPWQLRAFALAVAAHTSGQYEWSDFQAALIASIKDWESANDAGAESWSYFEHWVNAVETVLSNNDLVDPGTLDARVRDVLDAPPNRNHHEPHYEPVAVDPGL